METAAKQERNRLQYEKSPYLLQHADNPVDWYPWGDEAFDKAKRENKLIFLSIGYSTCHWCHVMEHESFEDPQVAALMNEVFVSIKVDREERPDIDSIYMTICQLLTGSGGWPLNVFLTPDKQPFFAGTYFPKTSRFGRVGMLEMIPQIQDLWRTQPDKVIETSDQVLAALQRYNAAMSVRQSASPTNEAGLLQQAYEELAQRFDPEYGGFSEAPKFPSPHTLLFLLRYWKRSQDDTVLAMVEKTLRAMRLGGIYDHIGFGFHRYSTDRRWLLPHFEKMLYDQALLALAYIEAYQATGSTDFRQTAGEIFQYVLRDMSAPEGGFYSAEDADSEGVEGKFYLWSAAELRELLSEEDAELLLELYHVEESGNFQDQAGGTKTGENILHLQTSLSEIAERKGLTEEALRERLETIRQQLFDVRENRIHPYKDDKILSDWNGLMIAALAKGAQALDEPQYLEAAEKAAGFLLEKMQTPSGRLLHRYRDGEAAIAAHLDDYAFLTWGLIELYEASFDVSYLEQALRLHKELQLHFRDEEAGAFYFTADDAEKLLLREKVIYDGALPSGNSVAMLNGIRLGRLSGDPELEAQAEQVFKTFSSVVEQNPAIHSFLLLGVDFGLGPSHEVVIVGEAEDEGTQQMLRSLRGVFAPNKVVLFRPANEEQPKIITLAKYAAPYVRLDGKATAYVCQNFICSLPTNDIGRMLKLLEEEQTGELKIPLLKK
ncbi:MAG: thioredoxin domain-containing protein [bacterium]|nr:thioredoxin domain-containing protein [bacterium]